MTKMLRLFLLFGAFLAAAGAMDLSAQVNIILKVKDMPAGKCRIYSVYGSNNVPGDTLKMDDRNTVTWSKPLSTQPGLYYFVLPDGSYFAFLLDQDQQFEMRTVKGLLNDSMKVTGCTDNELYFDALRWETRFQQELAPFNQAITTVKMGTPEWKSAVAARDNKLAEKEAYLQKLQQQHPNSFFTRFKVQGQNPKLQYPLLPGSEMVDTVKQTQLYKREFWNGFDFSDDRLVYTPVFHNKLKTYMLDLTPQQPDSVIASAEELMKKIRPQSEIYKYAVNTIAIFYSAKHQANNHDPNKKPIMMGAERVYVHMMENYYQPEQAPWEDANKLRNLQAEIKYIKNSALGAIGQDMNYLDVNGKEVNLYDLKSPASIVFVYSYTCDHCKEQAPQLVDLYNRWKARGLKVFAICIDPDPAKWKAFLAANQMDQFTNVHDPSFLGGNARKYFVDVTPEVYLMDVNHKIVARDLKPTQLDSVLADLLK